VKQRRLAGAGWAEEREALALPNLEVDVRQRSNGGRPFAVDDGQSGAPDQGFGAHSRRAHSTTRPSAISTTRSQPAATSGECVISTTADWKVSRSFPRVSRPRDAVAAS